MWKTTDRKTEQWQREQEQKAENRKFTIIEDVPAVSAREASDKALADLMTGPDAPEWARVSINNDYVAQPKTAAEVQARIDALEAEHADALAKLEKVRADQVIALNEMLASKRDAEDAAAAAARAELPARLKDTLEKVRSFIPASKEAVIAAPVDHVQRGKDALDRAIRRSRGEQVPDESEFELKPSASVPGAPTLTSKQAEVQARVAPALAAAAEIQIELAKWDKACGKTFDSLLTEEDDTNGMITDLMRGLPPTQKNVALVVSLLRAVRLAMELKGTLAGTLTKEVAEIEKLVATVESFGPMKVQNDFSVGHYDFEKSLVGAVTRLGTANHDSIATLWSFTRGVTGKLEAIQKIREENADTIVPPLEWQDNKDDAMGAALEAARRTAVGNERGRPPVAVDANWSVFDNGEAK